MTRSRLCFQLQISKFQFEFAVIKTEMVIQAQFAELQRRFEDLEKNMAK